MAVALKYLIKLLKNGTKHTVILKKQQHSTHSNFQ